LDRTPSKTHYDLRDAFAGDGCAICALTQAAVDRYFANLNYEAAGDRGVRAHLRQTLGFCRPHSHRWLAASHVLATAVIYAEVLDQTRNELRALSFRRSGPRLPSLLRARGGDSGGAAGMPPRASAPCPACVVHADSEKMLLGTLLSGFGDPAFRDAFARSPGLCLAHLRPALARAPDENTFTALRDAALAHEETLLAHLLEVIRKHDYRFNEELAGEERGAGPRAIRHVAGETAM
jgi:hypothetical protein